MKRQIRNSVFETNSSSTHAMCISKDPVDMNTYSGCYVEFTHGKFGWEWGIYNSLKNKAAYLYQALISCYGRNAWDEEKDMDKFNEYLDKLSSILGEYGITCSFEAPTVDEWGYDKGYIDHGGETKEFVEALFEDSGLLLRYLFNNDSYIVTGNDNDDYPEDDVTREDFNPDRSKYDVYWK